MYILCVLELIKPLNPLSHQSLKLYGSLVEAGFPSPADEYLEKKIDLNDFLIKKPSATYLVRVKGESMIGAGVFPGSYLVVDRSLHVKDGQICVARVGDEFTVKRYFNKKTHVELVPENEKFEVLKIYRSHDFEIQGVVRAVITQTV